MDEGCCLSLLVVQAQNNAGQPIWLHLSLIFILIILNGFFSASEMAVVTLNDNRIRKQAAAGDKNARVLLKFINSQSEFLATIQVGVTLAGFLSAAFGADRLAPYLYYLLDPSMNRPWIQTAATVLITIIISFLSLIFGELVPKRIGMSNPERYAKAFASVLRGCELCFYPFTKVLNAAANGISKLLNLHEDNDSEKVTEEEIRLLTEVSRESGLIHSEEADMINKVFELDDKEVSEIMTPRTAVSALSADSSWEEVLQEAAYGRFSRLPVYEEDIDNVIGILHIKDLLALLPEDRDHFDLRKILRPAYFVPESKTVNVLFREMRQNHTSLAVVIDEYGGMDGIISMEDVLEEIVGDIEDEYDAKEIPCQEMEDGSYVLDGRLTPEEAGEFIPELDAMEEDDAYDTMAGFVLSLLERIPEADEHPQVRFRNLLFTVLEMDDRRIAKIKIERVKEDGSEEANPASAKGVKY